MEEINDLLLVPDMISRGEHLDAQAQELFHDGRRDAEAGGGIFGIGDDQIDFFAGDNPRQAVANDGASRTPKNIADKQNAHECDGSR